MSKLTRNPYNITAFMPGTILQICVKPGDKVTKNTMLLVLDAMKMDNEIISSVNGIVKSVCVKEGQTVSKDELLIELASAE